MLRSFLTWLLGIDRGEIARGANLRLRFTSLWPTWVVLLFGVGALWLVFFLYSREKGTATWRRKSALAVVRCLLIALVLLVLFGPYLAVDKSELQQAYIVVLLDDSGSMGLTDTHRDPQVRLALARAARLVPRGASSLPASVEAQLDAVKRAELVNRILANPDLDFLGKLDKQCRLRVAAFAGDLRGLPPNAWRPPADGGVPALVIPHGDSTLLGAALHDVAEEHRAHRVAAVVAISDGQAHDADPTAVETAARLAVIGRQAFPVFTVGVGTEDESRDVEVIRVLAPDAAKKDDKIVFNTLVTSRGHEGEVEVQLRREGELVATRRVELRASGEPQAIAIPYTPDTKGTFRFTVSIPPVPDEADRENNSKPHVLDVKDAKTKVLLVAGRPSYFYRYLRNALIVDQSVQLSCWLQSADEDFHQEGNLRITHYPADARELFSHHVVIFHDVDPTVLSQERLKDLEAFVGRFGGGFIYVAGPSHPVEAWKGTPLERLLPVVSGGQAGASDLLTPRALTTAFALRLTRQGRSHGILRLARDLDDSLRIWGKFPGCYWYEPVARPKPGAVVLAEHPYDRDERGPMPLLVVGRYDPGRALYCGLDGTWRWRFWIGDKHFNRFWVQAIDHVGTYRILGGGRRVQLATDKKDYTLGQRVVIQAQCLDESFQPAKVDALTARVEFQGGPPTTVALARSRQGPGIFEGSFQATQPGSGLVSLTVASDTDSFAFNVRLPATELERRTMDGDTLRRIARHTRGHFVRLHELEQLDGKIQAATKEIVTEVPDPLFDAPIVVVLFMGLVCGEWWFRKRGMLS